MCFPKKHKKRTVLRESPTPMRSTMNVCVEVNDTPKINQQMVQKSTQQQQSQMGQKSMQQQISTAKSKMSNPPVKSTLMTQQTLTSATLPQPKKSNVIKENIKKIPSQLSDKGVKSGVKIGNATSQAINEQRPGSIVIGSSLDATNMMRSSNVGSTIGSTLSYQSSGQTSNVQSNFTSSVNKASNISSIDGVSAISTTESTPSNYSNVDSNFQSSYSRGVSKVGQSTIVGQSRLAQSVIAAQNTPAQGTRSGLQSQLLGSQVPSQAGSQLVGSQITGSQVSTKPSGPGSKIGQSSQIVGSQREAGPGSKIGQASQIGGSQVKASTNEQGSNLGQEDETLALDNQWASPENKSQIGQGSKTGQSVTGKSKTGQSQITSKFGVNSSDSQTIDKIPDKTNNVQVKSDKLFEDQKPE
ncbi:hypothetical protein BLOT_001910 [Blomia tropicalis]|nr:hypothetical protein BLOT_001910 [Blomia tropicalis]